MVACTCARCISQTRSRKAASPALPTTFESTNCTEDVDHVPIGSPVPWCFEGLSNGSLGVSARASFGLYQVQLFGMSALRYERPCQLRPCQLIPVACTYVSQFVEHLSGFRPSRLLVGYRVCVAAMLAPRMHVCTYSWTWVPRCTRDHQQLMIDAMRIHI
jgi:hypothetical protein